MSDRLTIELESLTDRNGQKYYLGKLKAPILIDCREGVSFLVFTSVEGDECIQISSPSKPKVNREPQ